MNMKKKLLATAVIALLASPVFAATDSHNVTTTVTEVALLNVADAATDIAVATTPTAAGDNFTFTQGTSTYAITSNIDKDNSAFTRTLTAQIDAIDTALNLAVGVTAPTGGTAVAATFGDGNTAIATNANVVTGIQNIAEADIAITYDLSVVTGKVPEYGTHTIAVTYTLSDDA